MGYDHLLAKNQKSVRRDRPPGDESWAVPLANWTWEWAADMGLSGHPEHVARRLLVRLATDAVVGRLCDATHRGARLGYIRTISRIDPADPVRAETFVGVVQRELEAYFGKGGGG